VAIRPLYLLPGASAITLRGMFYRGMGLSFRWDGTSMSLWTVQGGRGLMLACRTDQRMPFACHSAGMQSSAAPTIVAMHSNKTEATTADLICAHRDGVGSTSH
jgi:hypothetical protein